MLKYLALTAAMLLAPLAAQAAQPTPDWGSDHIRTERPTAAQNALVLTYKQTVTEANTPAVTETGTVTLARDFNAVAVGDNQIIDDFTLCRVLAWSTADATLDNQSCYAGPAFRLSELGNRKYLQSLLADAAGKQTPSPQQLPIYWAEQELAMQHAPSDPLTSKTVGDTTQWRLGDLVVVQARGQAFTFTVAEKPAVARYFSRHTDLHPQVVRAILASGIWPAELVIERRSAGRAATESLEFSGAQRQALAYPLPAGLVSTLTAQSGQDTVKAKGLRAAIAVMAGNGPAKPGLQTLIDGIAAAERDHRDLEGALLFLELAQIHTGALATREGRAKLKTIGKALQVVYNAPASRPLTGAGDLAGEHGTGPDREAAARYLSTASNLDTLPFGTFRFVTFANLARYTDDSDKWDPSIFAAMPALADGYWTHIAAAPWGANVYSDLGNLLYDDYDMAGAWEAWDIGRAVDPDWATGAMAAIGSFEDRLRHDAPGSF